MTRIINLLAQITYLFFKKVLNYGSSRNMVTILEKTSYSKSRFIAKISQSRVLFLIKVETQALCYFVIKRSFKTGGIYLLA